MPLSHRAVLLLGVLALAACPVWGEKEYEAPLLEGNYRVAYGAGYAPGDEDRLLEVRALLDRSGGRLVLTLAGGTQRVLAFAPRPRAQWEPDCFTMASHYVNEVADLSPAPLQVESLTFATPLAFAKCGPTRMVLADSTGAPAAFLAFDRE